MGARSQFKMGPALSSKWASPSSKWDRFHFKMGYFNFRNAKTRTKHHIHQIKDEIEMGRPGASSQFKMGCFGVGEFCFGVAGYGWVGGTGVGEWAGGWEGGMWVVGGWPVGWLGGCLTRVLGG